MKTLKELRTESYSALKGNWGKAVLCAIVYFCFIFAATLLEDLSDNAWISAGIGLILSVFLCWPLGVGFTNSFRLFLTEGDNCFTRNTFAIPFRNYGHYLKGMALMNLYIFLWSLLCLVPGILMSFSYAMTPYILMERPELSADEALTLSREMMDGYRLKLFTLFLSFIGWILLGILTCGIGLFWVLPYMDTAMAAFYREVKSEHEI